MIGDMLSEVGDYYYNSIRKSILDYVLKNDEDKMRLGIMEVFDEVKFYGENVFNGIEPDPNWKNAVIFSREEMYDKLVKYNQASLQIIESKCDNGPIKKFNSLGLALIKKKMN